jgi:ATP/maltotriose-dependent transcriptional regulator MalT
MRRAIPRVEDGRLYQPETQSEPIVVGTSAWYDWLEQHTTFSFVDAVGTFTARKSMLKTRGSYWKVYRRRQGKLYRIHLGHSHTLTLERLQAAARAFAGEPADLPSAQPAASLLPSPRVALNADHAMSLLQTKLYRPRTRGDMIPRARLLERLNAGLGGKVTLVCAPAGFGKTTLLAEWGQTIDRPTAWLSLDEDDNELRVFVRSLTAALQSVFPDAGEATASLFEALQYPPPGEVASLIINDLADVPEDVILVLDDYHLIHTSEVHTLLDLLIEYLPPQLHLVLATRSDPPLPLARWRARGYLHELRSPLLLAARAWILQARGQLTELPRLLTAAEQHLATSGSGAGDMDNWQSRVLRALIATAWSQFQYFTGQAHASLESARSALTWIPPGEEYGASLALMFLAWSNQSIGNEDVALVALHQALRDHSSHLNSTARLLFAQAMVYLAAGKLHQVEHTARYLLQIAQQADLALSQNFAHWLLAVVSYERNNLDAAVYHFLAVITNRHRAHFWAVQDAMRGLALTYQAQGLGTQAQETARNLLELVQEQRNMGELMTAYAFSGQLALLQDEVEEASQWLELAGEQAVLGPMMFLEDPPITRAWMLLAQGDEPGVAQGQALLAQILQHVEAIHSTRKTIKVLALQAWAYDLQGREAEALNALERALALGRPGGFLRTFADLSPLAKLLQQLRRRRKTRQEVDNKLDAYVQGILAAMSPLPAQSASREELMQQERLEPLTERELQILRLLEKDLTNKEIANELVVTPGTVKVHTTNVYRKLSVNNRRSAVTLSKALGLLTAT